MPAYFLDTSALAKLYHQEAGSEFVERLVAVPGSAVVSRLSLVEIESVLATKVRTGQLDRSGQDLARRRLRADISQGRVCVAPPIEEQHYQSARQLLAATARHYHFERWTQYNWRLRWSFKIRG